MHNPLLEVTDGAGKSLIMHSSYMVGSLQWDTVCGVCVPVWQGVYFAL